MQKKLLFCVLLSASVFASNIFQTFDNEYNVGLAFTSGSIGNGTTGGNYNSQYLNLEVEHLFDNNIWLDINANLVTNYSQDSDPSVVAFGNLTGSQPNFGGININLGYGFITKGNVLLTPYGVLGRNTNLSLFTLENAGFDNNITRDYFITLGGGVRGEYIVNKFEFYLDQNVLYNISQVPVIADLNNNNYLLYTTTIGTKFNVYRSLQLGAKAFYSGYGFDHTLVGNNGEVSWVPTNSFGGMLTIGLTY